MKLAFVRSEVQPNLRELFESTADMYLVFSHRFAADQDIIKVGRDEVIKEGSEDIVDEMLEGSGGIGKSKGYNKGFKETIAGAESRFPFFSFSHAD